jgi:hypothetical protein
MQAETLGLTLMHNELQSQLKNLEQGLQNEKLILQELLQEYTSAIKTPPESPKIYRFFGYLLDSISGLINILATNKSADEKH